MPGLDWTQGDIRQALEVQFENTEIKRHFDPLHGFVDRVLFVADESEDNPDGQTVAERQPGGEIDRDDVLQPEKAVVDARECNPGATEADSGAYHIGVAIEPLGLAVAL